MFLSFCCSVFTLVSKGIPKRTSGSIRATPAHEQKECQACKERKRRAQGQESFDENIRKLDILKARKLSEVILGNKNALRKITIYSSFTCLHCRQFHRDEFPEFKKKYVDTGRVQVCLKNYPDDKGSLQAATLLRCLGGASRQKIEMLTQKIFDKQEEWMHSSDPEQFLKNIFIDCGYKNNQIIGCLKNSSISAGLIKDKQYAMIERGINLLPAFDFGGSIHQGILTCKQLAEKLGLDR
jgi:protein-disulfide isomerase